MRKPLIAKTALGLLGKQPAADFNFASRTISNDFFVEAYLKGSSLSLKYVAQAVSARKNRLLHTSAVSATLLKNQCISKVLYAASGPTEHPDVPA